MLLCYFVTAPSLSPVSVSVTIIDSRSFNVSWEPPPASSQNGIIREYAIIVVEIETSIIFADMSLGLHIVIGNLHPYYTYNISVSAVTVLSGPYSEEISVQTPQDGMCYNSLF